MTTRLHVRVDGREAIFGTAVGELRLGCGGDCAIRFTSDVVAEHHATLSREDTGWVLAATSDDNLLFRDGHPLVSARIDAPVTLRVGDALAGPVVDLHPTA